MKRLFVVLCILLMYFTNNAFAEEKVGYKEKEVIILPPDYDILATVCIPEGTGPFPAVVMLHRTGSSQNEVENAYVYTAHILAEKYGIATIRFDFPGNGISTADYMLYTFYSAVADAKAAAQYMGDLKEIDANRIGILGWGQGGTDALLACAWEPDTFKSIVTWAVAPDLRIDGFFTTKDYEMAQKNGYFVMDFDWRDSLNISLEWCEDVLNTDVLSEFKCFYSGPVLAIHGNDDTIVDPEWSEKVVEVNNNIDSKVVLFDGMDHTFNVLTGDLSSLYQAIEATGEFFVATLY